MSAPETPSPQRLPRPPLPRPSVASALPLAEIVRLACLMEATAPKPGNVHPGASFADLTYADFVASADAIAPVVAQAAERGIGATVLAAVEATRAVAPSNTNLGIVLLLVPLAAVPRDRRLAAVWNLLAETSRRDAELVFHAIRLAAPGGMGKVPEQDVAEAPTETLLEVMCRAAERDSVAAQYASGFDMVLNVGVPCLASGADIETDWPSAVVRLHLELMHRVPDTLIQRKCGADAALEASRRAGAVLAAGGPASPEGRVALARFDDWLRADGHRRNPGTTADLVTATLFAAIREGHFTPPTLERVRQTAAAGDLT